MFHKVKNVKPIGDYNLLVTFTDDTVKIYDVSRLFSKWEIFGSLKTVAGMFNQVKVDIGGYGISWNDEIDLSCDELWDNGVLTDRETVG
ncbi:MAG: DUF2442 domain-containing protein [Clostridiales bacterium]|nr:DUF2442 domain-containing protein [Clostridiales bacterium]